jgi:hypothetical protein
MGYFIFIFKSSNWEFKTQKQPYILRKGQKYSVVFQFQSKSIKKASSTKMLQNTIENIKRSWKSKLYLHSVKSATMVWENWSLQGKSDILNILDKKLIINFFFQFPLNVSLYGIRQVNGRNPRRWKIFLLSLFE